MTLYCSVQVKQIFAVGNSFTSLFYLIFYFFVVVFAECELGILAYEIESKLQTYKVYLFYKKTLLFVKKIKKKRNKRNKKK